MDSIDHVSTLVRTLLRERSIDPLTEVDAVRALVEQVVDDFLIACADGTPGMPTATPRREDLIDAVGDSVTGFGPLQRYLDDPNIEEIWINHPSRVFVARNGRSELTSTVLTDSGVRDLVERMLSSSGRRLDLSSPFVDAALPDGSRLHVAIPDITRRHWAVNLRKHVCAARELDDLVRLGAMNQQLATFLSAAVVAGLNILVAGATQAGKTTALNALLGAVPASERVVTCEETFELQLADHPDWVAMQTRQAGLEGTGEITLRDLVREALRMRPTRLIVGEVRQQEALDLLVAMNSGMPAMASLHANSAREAVTKLCTLPLLAGANISADFVVPTVAGCVDLVVHLETTASGQRRVSEVAALSGRVENGVIELAPMFVTAGSELVRADGFPPHEHRFVRAGFDLPAILGSARAA
ncbi:MAG: ATPase, T2SS/T4P/T4SS family [Candidatus Nanopelagicales bacterium]